LNNFSFADDMSLVCPSVSADIRRQYRALCVRTNILIRRFASCSKEVKTLVFTSYCSNVYCGALWSNHSQADIKALDVCYNNAYRWLIGQTRPYSASNMFVSNRVVTFGALMRGSVFSLKTRIEKSEHMVMCQIRNYSVYILSKCVAHWQKMLHLQTLYYCL
jgi:hypothetical protein